MSLTLTARLVAATCDRRRAHRKPRRSGGIGVFAIMTFDGWVSAKKATSESLFCNVDTSCLLSRFSVPVTQPTGDFAHFVAYAPQDISVYPVLLI
jgi:hypothetical protein